MIGIRRSVRSKGELLKCVLSPHRTRWFSSAVLFRIGLFANRASSAWQGKNRRFPNAHAVLQSPQIIDDRGKLVVATFKDGGWQPGLLFSLGLPRSREEFWQITDEQERERILLAATGALREWKRSSA